jgi:RHS repeat-associated protein
MHEVGNQVTYRAMDSVGNVYRTADLHDRHYSPGGRLEEADGIRYIHDVDGNLTQLVRPDRASLQYKWNGAGKLCEVDRPDGMCVRFRYDALGRRIHKAILRRRSQGPEEIVGETQFVWDGYTIIHERDSRSGLTTWHWEPNSFTPVAKEQNRRLWTVSSDHLGVPTEMYDEHGQLAWSMRLDVYGSPIFETGSAEDCPWRWPGQYEDVHTNLFQNNFRWYDPFAGCFISDDPLGLRTTFGLQTYVDNPLWEIDPLSLARPGSFTHPAGVWITGGGNPVFPSLHNVRLPPDLRGPLVSDARQMRHATRDLRAAIGAGTVDATQFTKRQLSAIQKGKARIPGLTWHHHPNGTMLQLVDRELHGAVGHDGGRKKTGGRC